LKEAGHHLRDNLTNMHMGDICDDFSLLTTDELAFLLKSRLESKAQLELLQQQIHRVVGECTPISIAAPSASGHQQSLIENALRRSDSALESMSKRKKEKLPPTRKTLRRLNGIEKAGVYPQTIVTLTPKRKLDFCSGSTILVDPSPVVSHYFGGQPPKGNKISFFSMMQERETIRRKKDAGEPYPWTENPIFLAFKFTNVKREHDATTRWMREHWTGPHASSSDFGTVIFNCGMFESLKR
jgi:hypothetical protein